MAESFTLQSRLKDIYAHPVGHDVLHKVLLQMGLGDGLITNPVVGRLRLSTLSKLTGKKVDPGFFDTLLHLLNNAPDRVQPFSGTPQRPWWKSAVFYQIYPRSFMDANGDGIGDLQGIIEKLDYLKDLGVDCLWLSPIYDSPQDDNGYDIRDYYAIDRTYGTVADFDTLMAEVHRRDMRLIMDLVVNHTSDEHAWFQKALADTEAPERDYYFLREEETIPNNWTSFFSGPAWRRFEDEGLWGLRLFSSKQMDLNWENADMRQEVYRMIRWWLDKGVDGFRMDVINYISKTPGLPDGDPFVGQLMGYTGIEHYFYGPKLHDYLREMRSEVFAPTGAFSVGETPGVGMEMSKLLTGQDRQELDMVFAFDILEMPGKVRFDDYRYELWYLKQYLMEWMDRYGDGCWMSLFYENHDNPRMVSKVDPEGTHREAVAKLLLTLQLTLKGTPFLFQGQELGAVNVPFASMEELRDVESLNLYKELLAEGKTEPQAFHKVLAGTRDHARVPMQWDDGMHGGFTTGTPWIGTVADGHNAKAEQAAEDSVWHYAQQLIALRRRSEALVYGGVRFVQRRSKRVFTYYREAEGEAFFIECNLTDKLQRTSRYAPRGGPILCNVQRPNEKLLQPYEARIYRV